MRTRLIGALAALVSAAVHMYLWFDGVKDQGTVGALFVVNVLAGAVIAGLLLLWRHWIPLFLLAGFGASTLGAFLIATTAGLFGIHTGWSWYAWLAAVSEVAAIICGVYAAVEEGYLAPSSVRRLDKKQDGRRRSRSHSGPESHW
jgi:hypothetical protein